ncbi:MAG: prefoldin subunit [Candidatus Thalassarchaeaceae archaeon]|jgi:chaperonin cofactor prefoldin|nr:prefoldin subunit [Candidatus Thalassarchaeaceae archaeon]MEE2629363.1 prefoldin subunit [Candidatus Thermoplasmatota archaeon]
MADGVSTEEIQAIARELQLVRSQIQTISSQVSEFGITIEALGKQHPDRPVYRSLGNLLLEVEDREKLLKELESSRDAVEEHLKRLIDREDGLRKQYEQMVEDFEDA